MHQENRIFEEEIIKSYCIVFWLIHYFIWKTNDERTIHKPRCGCMGGQWGKQQTSFNRMQVLRRRDTPEFNGGCQLLTSWELWRHLCVPSHFGDCRIMIWSHLTTKGNKMMFSSERIRKHVEKNLSFEITYIRISSIQTYISSGSRKIKSPRERKGT